MSNVFLSGEKRKNEIIEYQLQYLEEKFQVDPQELETARRALAETLELNPLAVLFLPMTYYDELFEVIGEFLVSNEVLTELKKSGNTNLFHTILYRTLLETMLGLMNEDISEMAKKN